jgi:hypothetical protein
MGSHAPQSLPTRGTPPEELILLSFLSNASKQMYRHFALVMKSAPNDLLLTDSFVHVLSLVTIERMWLAFPTNNLT